MAIDDPNSVYSKIGPVRLFLGNLNEGTTEEEVLSVVEPLGEIRKIDVKVGLLHSLLTVPTVFVIRGQV